MQIVNWKNCTLVRRESSHQLAWRAALLLICLSAALLGSTALADDDAAPLEQVVSAEELAKTALFDLEPEEWWEPEPIEWRDGMKPVELNVRYETHNVRDHTGARRRIHLRSYNGGLVGPTLIFRAGDTLRVKLVNNLPKNVDTPADAEAAAAAHHAAMSECPNVPHDFNTTNLHTHGLHISPRPPADDVLRSVEPEGGFFDYVFPILPAGLPPGQKPGSHYPGTFWYHAHRHGSTAIQLASGMAGALILKGDVDEVPEIKNAKDRLFIFQQIAYDANGKIEDFNKLRDNWEKVVQEHTRINGCLKPKIKLRPGQIERWRMIDSGVFADVPIRIVPDNPRDPPFQLFQIAADGISFKHPRGVNRVELGPGNRVDLLVRAPTKSGRYFLRKAKSNFDLTAVGGGEPSPAEAQILAEIEVRGEVCRPSEPGCGGIPRQLPAPSDPGGMLPPIEEHEIKPGGRKNVTFSVEPSGGPIPKFMIENECYKPDRVLPKFDLELNTAEEWTLINTSTGPHPFHIHVNAFQLMDAGGVWRDTVMIPPASPDGPGKVTIRTRFERFDGTFVTHCHILNHEDLGMMQEVRINPERKGAKHD